MAAHQFGGQDVRHWDLVSRESIGRNGSASRFMLVTLICNLECRYERVVGDSRVLLQAVTDGALYLNTSTVHRVVAEAHLCVGRFGEAKEAIAAARQALGVEHQDSGRSPSEGRGAIVRASLMFSERLVTTRQSLYNHRLFIQMNSTSCRTSVILPNTTFERQSVRFDAVTVRGVRHFMISKW